MQRRQHLRNLLSNHPVRETNYPSFRGASRKQIVTRTTACLAGVSAILAFMTLMSNASIGAGLAGVGIPGMIAVVSYFILTAGNRTNAS